MNGSKRARNTPSIANKTSVFGIMGGLAPRTGTSDVAVYRHQQIKGSRGLPQLYGKSVDYQKTYLKTNKLLSVNPLGSGGVGKKTSMFHQSCNCSQNIPMSVYSSQRTLLGGSFTGTEVVKHNTRNDAWVVYNGNVYNITNYPDQIHFDASYLGTDITYSVSQKHNHPTVTSMEQILEQYYIGTFESTPPPTTSYTATNVSTHNTAEDAWISYDEKVYDITTNPWKAYYTPGTDITDARNASWEANTNPLFPDPEAFEFLLQFYQKGVLG